MFKTPKLMTIEEAFKALNDKQSRKKISESAHNNIVIVALPGDILGYPQFFADDMMEYMEDIEDNESAVAQYYADKNANEKDLLVKKIFIADPSTWTDDDGNLLNITLKQAVEEGLIEEFGFQIANGDYLYTRPNHDIGPAYVKCKNYASMCDYIRNGYAADNWNVDDIVEEALGSSNTIKSSKKKMTESLPGRPSRNCPDVWEIEAADAESKLNFSLDMFADEVEINCEDCEENGVAADPEYAHYMTLPREQLMIKKVFLVNPKTYADGEELSEEDLLQILNDQEESFGFQIANGDYWYTSTGPDDIYWIPCKNYDEMCKHILNGVE